MATIPMTRKVYVKVYISNGSYFEDVSDFVIGSLTISHGDINALGTGNTAGDSVAKQLSIELLSDEQFGKFSTRITTSAWNQTIQTETVTTNSTTTITTTNNDFASVVATNKIYIYENTGNNTIYPKYSRTVVSKTDSNTLVLDAAIPETGSGFLWKFSTGTFSPMCYPMRQILVRTAIMSGADLLTDPQITSGTRNDFVDRFYGYLGDDISFEQKGSKVSLNCRDKSKLLQRKFIMTPKEYGTSEGKAVEKVMQDILTENNISDALYTARMDSSGNYVDWQLASTSPNPTVTPNWYIIPYMLEYKSVWDALQELTISFGWYLGYIRYRNTTTLLDEWRLTLFNPPRYTETTLTGIVSISTGGNSVVGTGTLFGSELAVGNKIMIAGVIYTVTERTSDTALKIYQNYSGVDVFGVPFYKITDLSAHYTLDSDDFYTEDVDFSDANIRNKVVIAFLDKDNNNTKTILTPEASYTVTSDEIVAKTNQTVLKNQDSIDTFGEIPMMIELGNTTHIDTEEEALQLGQYAINDLSEITSTIKIDMPVYLPQSPIGTDTTEFGLFNLVTMTNTFNSTSSYDIAINTIQETYEFSGDSFKARMQIGGGSKVIGAYKKWLNIETRPGKGKPTTADQITNLSLTPVITNFQVSGYGVDSTAKAISSYVVFSWTRPTGYKYINEFSILYKRVTNLTGTISVTNGSDAVTGNGTTFTTSLTAGDEIVIGGVTYEVSSITNDTSLTLTENYASTTSLGLIFYKATNTDYEEKIVKGSVTETRIGELPAGKKYMAKIAARVKGGYLGIYTNNIIFSTTKDTTAPDTPEIEDYEAIANGFRISIKQRTITTVDDEETQEDDFERYNIKILSTSDIADAMYWLDTLSRDEDDVLGTETTVIADEDFSGSELIDFLFKTEVLIDEDLDNKIYVTNAYNTKIFENSLASSTEYLIKIYAVDTSQNFSNSVELKITTL